MSSAVNDCVRTNAGGRWWRRETAKVATRDDRTAVADLPNGDEVTACLEGGGRHFGETVEESIVETWKIARFGRSADWRSATLDLG
jgi:hypothetical protein